MGAPTPEPFTVHFSDSAIDDLKTRLARTRWPLDAGNEDWRYGTSSDYLRDFVGYWQNDYDWRAAEAEINRFDHYRVELEGIPIHFVWARGTGPAPVPLIATHGWPWTFWDLHRMIRPLADPAGHGGDPGDSFDVVVPSLPGFGFSSPLTRTGIGAGATARIWRTLMHDVLGYPRFGAQGGDFGAIVTQTMAQQRGEDLIGVHLSRYKRPAGPGRVGQAMSTGVVTEADYGPGEQGEWERQQAALPKGISHLAVNQNDPQSLSFGLNDSPAGLAGWLLERRRAWSGCDGDLERVFDREFLATTLSLYWLTETFPTSLRMYWETAREEPPPTGPGRVIDAPVAIGVLPRDVIVMPRKHAEEDCDLRQWTKYPQGGHFGPAEVPDLIVADLREFFRPLRTAVAPHPEGSLP